MAKIDTDQARDPRADLDDALRPKECAILATLDQVKGKHVTTPIDRLLQNEITRLIVSPALRADARKPHASGNRREGRLLVLTGSSGSGKTASLTRALSRHPLLMQHDLDDPRASIAFVTVTSPCTLKQLGRDTLRKMGYPLERDIKEHLTWEQVRYRLAAGKKKIVVFDEMQHITQTVNIIEQEKVANTIKDLMINHEWRSSIIVCGLPAVADFIRRDEQLKRRATFVWTKQLRMPDDNADIAAMIAGLAKVAALDVPDDVETEIAPRLIHAAGCRLGVAVEITHDAIETALAPNYLDLGQDYDEIVLGGLSNHPISGVLTLRHFAQALERRLGCVGDENPFVSLDWTGTLPPAAPPSEKSSKRQSPRKKGDE